MVTLAVAWPSQNVRMIPSLPPSSPLHEVDPELGFAVVPVEPELGALVVEEEDEELLLPHAVSGTATRRATTTNVEKRWVPMARERRTISP
jgi:hypothetical protein